MTARLRIFFTKKHCARNVVALLFVHERRTKRPRTKGNKMTAALQIAILEETARIEREATLPHGFEREMFNTSRYLYRDAGVTLEWSHALNSWVASTTFKHVVFTGRGESPVDAIGQLAWELSRLTDVLSNNLSRVTAFRDEAHGSHDDITCGGVEMMPTEVSQ